jgi:hypothetical protein
MLRQLIFTGYRVIVVDQDQQPSSTLMIDNDRFFLGDTGLMWRKALAGILAATAIVAALFSSPADAAPKEKRQRSGADAPSLDGRVTGQPRTCGSDTFRYSSSGTTTGPYCH